MSWELLPVNYTDAVWSGNKKYTQIDNPDGTVSFLDVTAYTGREKSFFGAREANRMNEALNTLMSMVENGTDLYAAFQNYFNIQKELFTAEADNKYADFERYAQELQDQGDAIIAAIKDSTDTQFADFQKYAQELQKQIDAVLAAIKSSTDTEFSDFEDYVAELKAQGSTSIQKVQSDCSADYQTFQTYLAQLMTNGNAALDSIEKGYQERMATYESSQQAAFNEWFGSLQEKLSGDVATKLTAETTELDERLARLEHMVIQNDITAPVTDDDGALLVDDLGVAIVADWKHKEE